LDAPKGGLIGRPITEMIRPGDKQQGDGERTLGFHLSARTGFSDISVRAAMAKEERWWSISGQPVFNEYGQFHGFRGSGTDLTEMRRSQAEVHAAGPVRFTDRPRQPHPDGCVRWSRLWLTGMARRAIAR
jgi:hypothetical protein